MAKQFAELSDEHQRFIAQQHIFFVGSAAADGRVNVSPKGQDSLRVLSPNELLWLNLTGSGNETAAHLQLKNRLTLMWCAFAGPPLILRAYGEASVVHPQDEAWSQYAQLLPAPLGARQYFRVQIDLVQTSCGYAVPNMEYQEDRQALALWSDKKGQSGIEDYWAEKNQASLDGFPTGIFD